MPAATPARLGLVASLGALGVFLWRLGVPAYWLDEATTAAVVQRSWQGVLDVGLHADPALVAYYLLVKPFGSTVGAEGLLRLPSAVAAAATVGVITGFASRWLGRRVGVCAALLLVALPVTSRYAQEARPYALATLGVACVVSTWWLASREGARARWWWAYAFSLLFVALINPLALTAVLGPVAASLASRGRRRALLLRTAWVSLVAVALASPLLVRVVHSAVGVARPPTLTSAHVWEAVSAEIGGGVPALVGFALALVGLVLLVRRDAALGVLVGCWAFAGPVVLVTLAAAGRPFLVPRYFVLGTPALAVLAAVVVMAAARRLAPAGRRGRYVAGGLAAASVVAVAAVGLPAQVAMRAPAGHGEDVRPALALLEGPWLKRTPVVVNARVWTLSVQAYRPAIVATRMPTIGDPMPPYALEPDAVGPVVARVRLSRLKRVAMLIRVSDETSAPMPDDQLPPGLRGRACTQRVTAYDGWWVDVFDCGSA